MSNKGGTQHHNPQFDGSGTQGHLDWLTYTVEWRYADELGAAIGRAVPPDIEFMPTGEKARAIHGYTDAVKLGIGAASFKPDDRKQKIAVQFTGADWQAIERENIDPRGLINHIAAVGGRATRIDFALDIFAPGDPDEIYREWEAGRAKTRAETAGRYHSAKKEGGKVIAAGTTYIGHTTSYQQLRVYDKAKEQKVPGDWIRAELVTRKEGARRLAQGIADHGVVDAGQQAIRDFFTCEVAWFKRAVEGRAVHLNPITHPIHDTERWLTDDVMPVLERTLRENAAAGDWALYDKVLKVIQPVGMLRGRKRL